MNWSKIVLLFQAIVTLIIGLIFFSQLIEIKDFEISALAQELKSEGNFTAHLPGTMIDIKNRYTVASWTLLVVGLIEVIIITRLID